ncbi:hypothetical protein OE352_004467 [Salmonella bongori]|uniref:hypothetical protein n=1 Tax=Salmonella bongori TaxID=54736 RepID=UPI00126CABD4|nr:hypothetical protein [Salmonella bongori]ECG8261318.1 hypothetical protein [Salmonella bongori serovar 48:i:-]EEO9371460.1 hypothetical protein [Salmonella bongori]EHU5137693.1 hypothetical protein [Salmonella bongori]EJX9721228.1 hypothetical protein [Salmonella bongori]EJX9730086.1 hypothetical protein [Salmonella bongori]
MGEYDFILFEVNNMKHINRQLLLFIFTLIIATASTPVLAIACLGAGESLQQCADQTCPYAWLGGALGYWLCL